MFRAVYRVGVKALDPVLRWSNYAASNLLLHNKNSYSQVMLFSRYVIPASVQQKVLSFKSPLLQSAGEQICNYNFPILQPSTRSVTKFSLRKGKRKTVKAVIRRFFRLDWGIWIRTKAGRQKHLWKKSAARKRRLRQHVFCNATQTTLLDKMVTRFWKKRHYYVDDPYEPYHKREEFIITRKRPI